MSSIRFVTMFQKWVYEQHQNVCADFGIDYIYEIKRWTRIS